MESDQEVRHNCKFCYKSFPCGRSLGGHMRSHLPNTSESAEKLSRKKLSTLINYDDEETRFKDAIAQNAYSLRENRKKTSKVVNSNEDNYPLEDNKMCKECGKEFTSWKSLFGHMKCHSDKFSNSIEDDSLKYSNEKAVVMVMDSQSDNEFTAATPIRRQRSSRTFKRYRNATTTTTLSITNVSPCVSEIDQEQEQVALSLLMLSRDVPNQRDNWKSIHDEGKYLKCDENTLLNSINVEIDTPNPVQSCSKLEVNSLVDSRNGEEEVIETKNSEVSKDVFLEDSLIKKPEVEERIELLGIKKKKPIKRKLIVLDQSPQMSADCSMKLVSDSPQVTEEYLGSDKKIKFECTSCNKIFHSYQALGGHRASHKKKACLGAKFDNMENNNDTELSDLKLMTTSYINHATVTPQNLESCNASAISAITSQNLGSSNTTNNSVVTSQNLGSDGSITTSTSAANNNLIPRPPRVFDPKFKSRKVMISESGLKKLTNSDNVASKKINRLHECPLCFKVFPSGQAFGGHKRYHLLAEAKNNNNKQTEKDSSSVIDQKQIPEKIKDFLDLNLPAPEQEESSSPWWMANNHKRHPLHVGPL